MASEVRNDMLFGVVLAVGYLAVRLVLWPVWDRPIAWPDVVLAVLVSSAAVGARWTRHH